MMNSIFADHIGKGWVMIYMHDILLFAKDKETLEEWTKKMLQ